MRRQRERDNQEDENEKLKRTERNPNETCVHTERFWDTVEIRKFQWGPNVGRFEISYSFIDSDAPFQSWEFFVLNTLQLRNSFQVL